MTALCKELCKVFDGGKNSGNFGHEGRPGKIGGSGAGGVAKFLDDSVINHPEKHSLGKYIDKATKKLTSDRKRLHVNIANHLLKNVNKTDNPIIYFNGGGSASGKTTAIEKLFPEIPSNSNENGVIIDPDAIKKLTPEYQIMNSKGDPNAAPYVHEESSALAKYIQLRAMKSGDMNVLIDGTLAGNPEKVKGKILDAKATGNPVYGNFVTIPLEEALKRNYLRYLSSGRLPSIDEVVRNHKAVSRNFPQVAGLFDNVNLIDNDVPMGEKGKIIATGNGDGKIKILDKKAYEDFINKQEIDDAKAIKDFVKMIPQYEQEWLKSNPDKKLKNRPKL